MINMTRFSVSILFGIVLLPSLGHGWTTSTPVPQLLTQYAKEITQLKKVAASFAAKYISLPEFLNAMPYNSDIFYLRYCLLLSDSTSMKAVEEQLEQSLQWRSQGEPGPRICVAARTAVAAASSPNAVWTDNDRVFDLAPNAAKISPYITPANCITTTSEKGDLVYCIRAGAIADVDLFTAVTVPEMVEFFLYVKEVHALVSDLRSAQSNQLIHTITCNDLANVKLIGGSSDFRKALSQASTLASTQIYPSTYSGPTLLCNLPMLLSALIQLFTPLFPDAVKERLKFVQGPLSKVTNLRDIATTASSSPARTEFLQQLNKALYV
jgi:hypothetical protein